MKSLTITLLVALFCVTVSGVNLKDTVVTEPSKNKHLQVWIILNTTSRLESTLKKTKCLQTNKMTFQ